MDLISYICDESENTEYMQGSLFDGTEFDATNLGSITGLQDELIAESNTGELIDESFNFGEHLQL